jgi:MFS family permease
MNPEDLKQIVTGTVGNLQMTEGFLLGAAIMMEIPFAMILLARFLPYRANRWANIVAGAIMTTVQVASLFVGSGLTLHYIFYSIIEIACTAIIVWLAWRWRNSTQL